jgi:hypothetical protein
VRIGTHHAGSQEWRVSSGSTRRPILQKVLFTNSTACRHRNVERVSA